MWHLGNSSLFYTRWLSVALTRGPIITEQQYEMITCSVGVRIFLLKFRLRKISFVFSYLELCMSSFFCQSCTRMLYRTCAFI